MKRKILRNTSIPMFVMDKNLKMNKTTKEKKYLNFDYNMCKAISYYGLVGFVF
jgi:hypothetical protein